MKILRICMPANYLRVLPLSIIIWLNHQSYHLWSGDMTDRLYYDRILTMTAWKINHLDRPLQELKKIRKQIRNKLKCDKKPFLKSCKKFKITSQKKAFLNQYLLRYSPPNKWIHWSAPQEIDDFLRDITNSEIDKYLSDNSRFLNYFEPELVKMHILAEKLARVLKLKYSTDSFNQFNDIPWWYFLILLVLVLLNISLCNEYYLIADIKNER